MNQTTSPKPTTPIDQKLPPRSAACDCSAAELAKRIMEIVREKPMHRHSAWNVFAGRMEHHEFDMTERTIEEFLQPLVAEVDRLQDEAGRFGPESVEHLRR